MSLLQTTSLPHISVQKIYLNSQTITVNGSLTSLDEGVSPFLMNEEYFSEFVNIYFLLVDDGVVTESMLSDHSSRVASVLDAGFDRTQTSWADKLKNRYDHHIITLKDAVITLDPDQSDIENNIGRSSISRSEYTTSNDLKNINFSVEFDYNLNDLYDGDQTSSSSVKLFVFAHLDVQRLSSEYNLQADLQSTLELDKIGGNFKSYPVLVSSEGNTRYLVPETTTILTYQDGTPYVGSYHYHSAESRGPGDYIGFMEGPSEPHMIEGARPLRQTSIPYSKVVANFLLDDTFYISEYNGSQELFDFLDPASGETGGYNSYLPPTMGQLAELDSLFESTEDLMISRNFIVGGRPSSMQSSFRIYDEQYQQTLYRKYFENIQNNQSSHQIVKNAEHDLDSSEEGYVIHKLEFELDFKKLVNLRSKYPFLEGGLVKWFRLGEDEIAKNSRIQSLVIKRTRLSNHPSISNNVDTPIHDIFDKEEPPTIIATSQQKEGNRTVDAVFYLDDTSSHDGRFTLEERANDFSRDASRTSMSRRKFILKDFQLSERVNFGKYAYTLQIVAEDRIKSSLMEKRDRFANRVKKFKQFLVEASTPALPRDQRYLGSEVSEQQSAIDAIAESRPGSFNFSTNEYTEFFASRSRTEHDQNTRDLIGLFIRMHGTIGNIPIDPSGVTATTNRLKAQLTRLLVPESGGQLATAERFAGYCADLLRVYDDILLKDGILQVGSVGQTNTLNSTVGLGARHPQDQKRSDLYFEKRIAGHALAYKQGTIFANYGVRQAMAQDLNPGDIRQGLVPGSISVALEDSRSQQLSNDSQNLEDITRTQPELLPYGLPDAPRSETRIPDYGIGGFSHEAPGHNNLPADVNYNFSDISVSIDNPLGPGANTAIKNNLDTFDPYDKFTSQNAMQTRITEEYVNSDFFSELSKSMEMAINDGTGDYFENKEKELLVRFGDSAEADYVPMTIDAIDAQPGQTVQIKIDTKSDESQGNYRVVTTSVSVSKDEAKSYINGNNTANTAANVSTSQTQTPRSATPSLSGLRQGASTNVTAAVSTTSNTTYTTSNTNFPGGSY
jgi:hypothetical protein